MYKRITAALIEPLAVAAAGVARAAQVALLDRTQYPR